MSTTINDIAKLLKSDDKKGDTSFWGIVHSTIEDGEGNVTGYNVSLDGSANGAVKCNKVVGAKQGDQVLVTLRANGEAVVVATKGGDTDAKDAQTTANQASQTASTASQTANTAYQMAQSVENHFWYDSNGAHVSTAKTIASGVLNTLINAGGMAIRSGTTELAKFTDSLIELGKNSASAVIDLCGGQGSIDGHYEYQGTSGIRFKRNSSAYFALYEDYVSYGNSDYEARMTANNAKVWIYDPVSGNSQCNITADQTSVSGALACQSLTVGGQPVTPGGGGVDYVTAQGVSNGWSYRKWYSGKCELWRSYTDTFAMSTSYNGGYSSSAAITLTLPFSVDNAVCTGTGHSAGNMVVASASGTTFSFRPFRMSSGSSVSRTFYFRIDGTYY